eukprot:scaffold4755_cov123-Isochrysis_galbana.AAC.3
MSVRRVEAMRSRASKAGKVPAGGANSSCRAGGNSAMERSRRLPRSRSIAAPHHSHEAVVEAVCRASTYQVARFHGSTGVAATYEAAGKRRENTLCHWGTRDHHQWGMSLRLKDSRECLASLRSLPPRPSSMPAMMRTGRGKPPACCQSSRSGQILQQQLPTQHPGCLPTTLMATQAMELIPRGPCAPATTHKSTKHWWRLLAPFGRRIYLG